MTRLANDDSRDMAVPCGVLGEHYVTRSKTANRAVAGFDLDLSGQRDDILAPRRGVIIAQMGCRRAAKNNAMRRLERGGFHTAEKVSFHLEVFEVGFIVRSGVKSDDLH